MLGTLMFGLGYTFSISAQKLTFLLPIVGARSALGIRYGNLLPCAGVHDVILYGI